MIDLTTWEEISTIIAIEMSITNEPWKSIKERSWGLKWCGEFPESGESARMITEWHCERDARVMIE